MDALFDAFARAMRDQLTYAEQRMFIGALISGDESAAIDCLRERVRALDPAAFRDFVSAARRMMAETQMGLQLISADVGSPRVRAALSAASPCSPEPREPARIASERRALRSS